MNICKLPRIHMLAVIVAIVSATASSHHPDPAATGARTVTGDVLNTHVAAQPAGHAAAP